MKIVNPLYDKAFKYLMLNNRLARKILSVILDTEVTEVSIDPQETVVPDEKRGLTLFRLDFKAVIKETDGSSSKVLIELQKSKYPTDIQRFRNYLGANYMTSEIVKTEDGTEKMTPYPIITVYILGYALDDVPYLAVSVNREVINSVNKERVNVKSFFIEHLTHHSHIIQIRRLPEERRTRLEKFLVFFNQAWCTEKKYIIDLQDVPEEFNDIAQYLQGPVMDNAFRRQLEAEEELDTIFDEQESKYLKQIEEIRKREEEAIKREEEAIKREEEAIKREEEERKLKEEERRLKDELTIKLAKQMKKTGFSIKEIATETGLSVDTIAKM